MKSWPDGHGFVVHELKISDVWMIDFYGGGGEVNLVRARARARARARVMPRVIRGRRRPPPDPDPTA